MPLAAQQGQSKGANPYKNDAQYPREVFSSVGNSENRITGC